MSIESSNLPKIRVSVTNWCNLKCTFCGGTDFPMENWRLQKQESLAPEDLFELVRCYRRLGGLDVHLTGGEPLGRHDLSQVISRLTEMGCRVELTTNGILLSRQIVEQLNTSGLHLLKISLHSATYRGFVEITRSLQFGKLLQAIRLAASQLPVRINMVVFRSNLNQVIPVIELSRSLGVQRIHLLDLTYYPNYSPELTTNWAREFVPLSLVVIPRLMEYYGRDFIDQHVFGCKFYELTLEDSFKVILKEAYPTLRHPAYCANCATFCHEGMFTVRVSYDGYVNICPTENALGFDVRASLRAGILE